MLFAWRG
ncbi:unnamed protein product [Cuscuta epithymum]|nr:unnamed protein product [Cuscuta epithymum]